MFDNDTTNKDFELAASLVNNTRQHIFLTGKAGTGKTTFLKYIVKHTHKNAVVVAPTGVAAINAGGMTMHSFFQLPFGTFIPGPMNSFQYDDSFSFTNRHQLLKNIRISGPKRELLQELELLIIDEVSMVRADMLDAVDVILRHFRQQPLVAFGGVQVLYIGDLFQLPPVVTNNEWAVLQQYYQSPFFFSSIAVQQAPPVYIELKKIYRQSQQQFIDILNRVRNNEVDDADYEVLNNHYHPGFIIPNDKKYITLTSHNYKADTINNTEIQKLASQLYTFKADIKGDFADKAFPTEQELRLKEGAQIMFIKNDSATERRYYNGKLATVKRIENDKITVLFENEKEEFTLTKERWDNIRYVYKKETDSIEEEELGSFTQYPVRLAWAITIHKSQGLTFTHAVIDAGDSFAAGQVYVALSRCTSLEGMVLVSRIHPRSISTDERILQFSSNEKSQKEIELLLESEQYRYWNESLINLFNLHKLVQTIKEWNETVPSKKLPDVKEALTLSSELLNKSKELAIVGIKFGDWLKQMINDESPRDNIQPVKERTAKAILHFSQVLTKDIIQPLQGHIESLKYAAKVRKYCKELRTTEAFIQKQLLKIQQASYGGERIIQVKELPQTIRVPETKPATIIPLNQKPAKGNSQAESFQLFNSGKSMVEIARLKNVTEGTVITHLSVYIRTGELSITQLMKPERLTLILPAIEEIGGHAVTPIKEILGDDFSYAEIRLALNHYHWLKEQEAVK